LYLCHAAYIPVSALPGRVEPGRVADVSSVECDVDLTVVVGDEVDVSGTTVQKNI